MTTSDSTQPEDYTILVDTREKNHNTLLIVAGVLILLALGAFWLFSPEEELELNPPLEQAEIDPIVRAQIEAAKQSPKNRQVPAGTPEIASFEAGGSAQSVDQSKLTSLTSAVAPGALQSDSTQMPPGDRARELIRSIKEGASALSMDQLFSEADQLQKNKQETDAYLLYFYAARQGHGPSAFALAQMNDPAYFSGGTDLLEKPDPMQAYKWYTVAVANKVAQAEDRLGKLRSSAETAAAAGDPAAQRLLLNWK